MTVSDTQTGTWKVIPGFSSYEASDRGLVRSLDRQLADGRAVKGRVLTARPSNRGYLLVDLVDDQGQKKTRTVHTLVLLTFVGPPPPGQETRHLDDNPLNNRWAPRCPPGNLVYGTPPENVADRMANSPAKPRPVKTCVRCEVPFEGNGRRCHGCVVTIGKQGARLLRAGVPLEKAAAQLDYPSAAGLHTLAVKHGGYGQPWSRRVTATLVALRDRIRADD